MAAQRIEADIRQVPGPHRQPGPAIHATHHPAATTTGSQAHSYNDKQ